jgi:hypothetical protein
LKQLLDVRSIPLVLSPRENLYACAKAKKTHNGILPDNAVGTMSNILPAFAHFHI